VPTGQGANQAAQRPAARPSSRKRRTWPPAISTETDHPRKPASSRAAVVAQPVRYDLEKIGKGAGALALGLYVLGLLIVNAYLFRLGASDFTLVRPRFVYTGALIVLLTLIALSGPAIGASFVWQRRQRGLPTFSSINMQMIIAGLLLSPAILWLCFWLLLATDSPVITRSAIWRQATFLSLSTFIAGLLSVGISIAIVLLVLPVMSSHRSFAYRYATRLYIGIVIFLVASVYVGYFIDAIYPKVPVQFGGGRAVLAQLMFKKDELNSVKAVGLPFPPNGNLSSPVRLAYQGEQSYIVELPNGRIFQIDKSLVSGIVIR
jgi:hypothetical protein